jgi:phosphoadenosine phosphosulfate reductase
MVHSIPNISTNATPQEILGIGCGPRPVKLACSFSVEDAVIIDIIHKSGLPIGVFALDTGRLNEETYEVADAIVERYGIRIDWSFPVEAVEAAQGRPAPSASR